MSAQGKNNPASIEEEYSDSYSSPRKRLRVLHLTECHAGGVSRAIQTAVEITDEHEHHLLWAGEEEPFSRFTTTLRMPAGFLRRVAAVRARVASLNPDVVFAHSSWAGVYSRLWKLGAPVIYEPHCYKFDDESQGKVRRQFFFLAEKILASRSRATAVLTPHENALASSLSPSGDRYFVPNVPTVSPDEQLSATGFQPGNRVVMIGRISPQKDPQFFLDTANYVRRRRPDLRFIWVGDGDSRMKTALAKANIQVTGWLERSAVARLLSRPAVYFHSARYEGFPLSVLDAAIFEHPIVARRISAFEGLEIPMESTPEACADLLCDVFAKGRHLEKGSEAARSLNYSMNVRAQQRALRKIYDSI